MAKNKKRKPVRKPSSAGSKPYKVGVMGVEASEKIRDTLLKDLKKQGHRNVKIYTISIYSPTYQQDAEAATKDGKFDMVLMNLPSYEDYMAHIQKQQVVPDLGPGLPVMDLPEREAHRHFMPVDQMRRHAHITPSLKTRR